jgi:hypothetical protein
MDWLAQRQAFIARTGFCIQQVRAGAVAAATFTFGGTSHHLVVDDEYGDLARNIAQLSLEVLLRGADDLRTYDTLDAWRTAINVDTPISQDEWHHMRGTAQAMLAQAGDLAEQITDLEWQLSSGRAQTLRTLDID